MKHLILALISMTFLAGAAAAQEATGHDATDRSRFRDAAERARSWDSEERDVWQKPGTVMRLLGLQRGDTVADIGAGTGYFTRLLSSVVGPQGRVYAVDIEQEMLDYLRGRKDLVNPDNIVPVLAAPDDPKLPAGELDLIFTGNTWHHLDNRPEYLKLLRRALKPYGRLAIVDWREGDLPEGPPPDHKVARETVVAELQEGGWTLTSESVALPYQYFLIFLAPAQE